MKLKHSITANNWDLAFREGPSQQEAVSGHRFLNSLRSLLAVHGKGSSKEPLLLSRSIHLRAVKVGISNSLLSNVPKLLCAREI